MSMYRVQQFLWFIFSRVNEDDIKFINQYLDEPQKNLFKKLSIQEQKHSIRVAKRIKIEYEALASEAGKGTNDVCKQNLILAALMHDIGKIYKKLNVIDKSVMVILNKLTKGGLRRFSNIKKVDVYYNHAEKGASLLKNYGFDERALFLVSNHHNKSITGDRELDMLKYCDSIS